MTAGAEAGSAVDFPRSSFTWLLKDQPSSGRFGIDAVLTLIGPQGGRETYFLGAQVFAGDVYGEAELFRLPAYEFAAAFSTGNYRIFRDAHGGGALDDSWGAVDTRFARVELDIRRAPCRRLEAVPGATMPAGQLVGRVRLPATAGTPRMELEFPVRHINQDPVRGAFQVETGPVLALSGGADSIVERLRRSYLIFNRLDRVELLLDDPRPAASGRRWATRLQLPCEIELLRMNA